VRGDDDDDVDSREVDEVEEEVVVETVPPPPTPARAPTIAPDATAPPDSNLRNPAPGPTPLFLACARGDVDEVERLVTAGANLNEHRSGITPLYLAALLGHVVGMDG
jgi:hypothetical protein